MKITIDDIKNILENCKAKGHELRMSDIFYAFALQRFMDKYIVYTVFFGKVSTTNEIENYDESPKIKYLKKYINANFQIEPSVELSILDKKKKKGSNVKYEDITFEENKDAMIKMIDELKSALDDGKIEYKEYSDRVTKLRIALNDKFSVSEKQEEQRVIVYSKYNDICPYCRHEIRRKTDEDMIAEIKEKYTLTPKRVEKDNSDE